MDSVLIANRGEIAVRIGRACRIEGDDVVNALDGPVDDACILGGQRGDGEQQRDFLYVKDAVDITLHLADKPLAGGLYNVGSGEAKTWVDLAHAIFASLGRDPQIDALLRHSGMSEVAGS